jgi:hypothetical protein
MKEEEVLGILTGASNSGSSTSNKKETVGARR